MTADRCGGRPGATQRLHRSVPAVVTSGLVLTVVLFCLVRQAELDSFRARLASDVSLRAATVFKALDDSLLVVTALGNFFEAADPVTRERFATFSTPLLQARGEIKALSWNPRLSRADLADFGGRRGGKPAGEYSVYERDGGGGRIPPGNRAFYYPVAYIEPLGENRKAIGFDVGSSPVRLAALELARDTGRPTATERIVLVQDGEPRYSVLVFNPLFGRGLPVASVAERRQALVGFTVAVLNVEKLLSVALGKTEALGLPFELLDLSAPGDRQPLYRWTERISGKASWRAPFFPETAAVVRRFSFCGRTWGVKITPSREYLTLNCPLASWLLLPAGAALSMLLGLYLRALNAKRQGLEAEVQLRTAELRASELSLRELNAHLEERVAERTGQLEAAMVELSSSRDRAEDANRAKSIFLANMSHEIRTPLNAVLGFSRIVMRDPALSPESRHNLTIVNRSGEQLLALINDLIEVAKVRTGRISVGKTVFDPEALLASVVEPFRGKAAAKGLQLVHDRGPDLEECYLVGDEEKIRQILANLIDNAVKFTRAGRVALRCRAGWRDGRDWLEIEVEDSGRGLTPDERERIFGAFEQGAGEAANNGGTGLGLTIGREFARLMGGELSVESAPGQGCRFLLAVPVDRGKALLPDEFEYCRQGGDAPDAEAASPADLLGELAQLPQELCERLLAAARALDRAGVLEAVAPFASTAPGVAGRLKTLSEGYRFDLIEEMVGQRSAGPESKGGDHD